MTEPTNLCFNCSKNRPQKFLNDVFTSLMHQFSPLCDVPASNLLPWELDLSFNLCLSCSKPGMNVLWFGSYEFERVARTQISAKLLEKRDILVEENEANRDRKLPQRQREERKRQREERKRLEKERQRLEEERQRLEDERQRKRLEEAYNRQELQRQEKERQRQEEERQRQEKERQRQEEERQRQKEKLTNLCLPCSKNKPQKFAEGVCKSLLRHLVPLCNVPLGMLKPDALDLSFELCQDCCESGKYQCWFSVYNFEQEARTQISVKLTEMHRISVAENEANRQQEEERQRKRQEEERERQQTLQRVLFSTCRDAYEKAAVNRGHKTEMGNAICCLLCCRNQPQKFAEVAYTSLFKGVEPLWKIPLRKLQSDELPLTFELCPLCCECGTRVYPQEVKKFAQDFPRMISPVLTELHAILVAENEAANVAAIEASRLESQKHKREQEEREKRQAAENLIFRAWRDADEEVAKKEADEIFSAAASAVAVGSGGGLEPCVSASCNGRLKRGVRQGLCGLCR